MTCPSCSRDNRPNAKFCGGCGTPLPRACPRCGVELPPDLGFCDECGAPLDEPTQRTPAAEPAGARKIVTILFADLAGSTALHERLDPESARRFMESYYAAAREAVESHGGTVTQFLGDGVKAVFGIPRVAEDDAMRAVRAGVAMQEAFRTLAEQQRAAVGETGLRVAVNSGEVVVKGGTEIIGDPVNVAARLQERGRNGDVVIGESTQRLVAAQVSLELLGTFDLKGRAEPVKAYRVLSISAPGRAATTAFVGRAEELARITAVFDRATETPAAHLAVLLGSPGLGKSRLIGEFARRCGNQARVVAAHCDAAGGATFAPIVDALREILSIETSASADSMKAIVEASLPDKETERKRIAAGVVGLLTGSPGAPEETFFVVRRFLAGLAATRPVVLVIDDLQWAEPLLIDLVEHLVQWGRGLPLLVLIGARPELREVRSSMTMQGGLVADVLSLDGLDAGAAMQLAAGVIGASDLPAAVAAKVLATSEGNPLFIGELVRMLVEEGALTRDGDRWTAGEALASVEMPPTIHALLAARIERLQPAECAALERAAVIGRHFSRGAVAALLPNADSGLDGCLESLQRAELIERDSGWFLGEPALRFHHVLIRDAAYRRLLKGTRAELHERLADWMEERFGDVPEHDETIGRHLEEAHALLGELGPIDEAGQRLGERAAARLAAAGRRALDGDDVPLAAGLLGRALERLEPDDPARADLALDWCEALLAAGDVTTAATAIDELGRYIESTESASADARTSPAESRLRAWHSCFVGHHTVFAAPRELSATVEQVATAATSLASLNDAAGEAKGHFVHALALSRLGQVGACEASLDRALAAARRAGDRRRANTVLAIAPLAALWGPSPVTRASGRCLDVVRVLRITQGAPAVEAVALSCQGVLEALRGRSEAAHRMIAAGREMIEELGIAQRLFEADVFAGFVAMLEGDAPAAERNLRGAYDGLRELGLGIDAARAAAMLARALLAQDRIDEAEALSHESEALAGDDLKAAIAWRGVRAEVLARRGQIERAIELARAGVAIAAATDALLDHAEARRSLATVLRLASEFREADEEDRRARALWSAKGAILLAERADDGGGVDVRAAAPVSDRHGGWHASTARVRPNTASRVAGQLVNALATGDFEAARGLYGDGYSEVNHPTGATLDAAGSVAGVELLHRSRGAFFAGSAVATLGDSLVLVLRRSGASGTRGNRYDVGSYENDGFHLFEVGNAGVLTRGEVFALDCLGEAVARLYEWYADGIAGEPDAARASWTARALAAWQSAAAVDELGFEAIDPAVEMIDHRRLGTWRASGLPAVLEQVESLREVVTDFRIRDEDILGLEPTALLRRQVNIGTERIGGGVYEREYLAIHGFADNGRMNLQECFDVDDQERALARFEELARGRGEGSGDGAVPQGPVPRRVRSNAASAAGDRFIEFFAAGDVAAMSAMLGDRLEAIDHRWHASYGRDGVLETWRRMMRPQAANYRSELIATLGQSLSLRRSIHAVPAATDGRFDVGEHSTDFFTLAQVDESEQFERLEFFAADRLGDAIVRLYELYAESLSEGPQQTRVAGIARALRPFNGPIDPDRVAPAYEPTSRNLDHRVFGTWTTKNAVEILSHYRHQLELAPDFAARFEDVLALAPDAMVAHMSFFGTGRDSGGAFENHLLVLFSFGADGRLADTETFEVEQTNEALARFDALSSRGVDRPVAAPSACAVNHGTAAVTPRPRLWSRADAFRDLIVDAWHARDWPSIEEMLHEDFRFSDRRPLILIDLDRNGWIDMSRRLGDMDSSRLSVETIATRGQRLVLWRVRIEVAGGDVGPSIVEHLNLFEANEAGDRLVWAARFETTDVELAYAELDARYEAGEGTIPSNNWLSIAGFVRAVARRDWDAVRALCRDDFVEHDHRAFAVLGETDGTDAWVDNFRTLVDLAPDTIYRAHHVLEAERGYFVHGSWYGTREGGPYELQVNAVLELDDEGRMRRADIYDDAVADAAFARLAELDSAISSTTRDSAGEERGTLPPFEKGGPGGIRQSNPSDRIPLNPPFSKGEVLGGSGSAHKRQSRDRDEEHPWLPPNAAMRAMSDWFDAFDRAFASGDWEEVRRGCHPSLVFDDRRRMALVRGGLDLLVASARERAAMGARPEWRPVGSFGDRVLAQRVLWSGGPSDGPFEIEYFGVVECDADGLLTAFVLFDLDDARLAQREAWARWAAIEPDATAVVPVIGDVGNAFNEKSAAKWRTAFTDDLVVEDHRLAGMGRIEGADAYTESVLALWELAPLTRAEVGWHWPALDRHGAITVVRRTGSVPDGGGDFENEYLYLYLVAQGRIARVELFETNALGRALARFEELRPPTPERKSTTATALQIPPNSAVRHLERWKDTLRRGSADALVALLHPSFVCDDRRRLVRTTTARAEEKLNSAFFIEGGWQPATTLLATAGDRLALQRWVWTCGDEDGPSEIELLELDELDDSGRFVRTVLFDPEDRAAAHEELFERYLALGAEGMPEGTVEFLRGWNEHNLDRARAGIADDFVLDDHRRTGMGRLEGADRYIESVAALHELIPDARADGLYGAAVDTHGRVIVSRTWGHNREGGEVESSLVVLMHHPAERLARIEFFELEHLDAALARLQELRSAETA